MALASQVPSLPSPSERRLVPIRSSDGVGTYIVDLQAQTCTCQDSVRRADQPHGSIGRACKHVAASVLADPDLAQQLSPLETCILQQGGSKLAFFAVHTAAGGEICVGVDPGWEWADVYFRKYRKGDPLGAPTGAWEQYGLSLTEWRWSYGEGPRGAREIKELLAPLKAQSDAGVADKAQGAGCVLLLFAFSSSAIGAVLIGLAVV